MYPKRIQNIFQYIAEGFAEQITLKDVADQAFLNQEAFCRYFKKHTGQTFISYLNHFRVKKVCEKLASNVDELSISNIAYSCGFTSVSNFNRMFKRNMGMSPTEYISSLSDKSECIER